MCFIGHSTHLVAPRLRFKWTLPRSIPVDSDGKWEQAVDGVATKRGYKNRDVINVTKEGLGDSYEAKLKMFFEV